MNRLQTELERLYLCGPAGLATERGQGRAMVLEVAKPADWEALRHVWVGVQAELELPAPAIAVSGRDGLQLWFSLAQPVADAQAQVFLEALRARWLPELAPKRVRLLTPGSGLQSTALPPRHVSTEHWSAFVSPDLAAVFSDTPWLDVQPGEEGQANLLRGLRSISPDAFEAAVERLSAGGAPAAAPVAVAVVVAPAPAPAPHAQAPVPDHSPARTDVDPRGFLARVVNDETAPLALRVEAAKALLPYVDD